LANNKIRRSVVALLGAATVVGTAFAVATPANAATAPAATPKFVHACTDTAGPHCMAIINTTASQQSQTRAVNAAPSGLAPADIQSAYGLTGGTSTATVAVIEAGDYPNVNSDLQTYRAQYGLPECSTDNGCLQVVNENGETSPLPSPDPEWATETALDVDAVSAACPTCHILVVEAPSENDATGVDFDRNMATANATAASMGAAAASNSWGDSPDGEQYATDPQTLAGYNQPGMAITVSTGDSGNAGGVTVPSSFSTVTAVGGTSLTQDSSARGWSETAWDGAGSGCSSAIDAPSWQTGTTCGGKRALADVSAVADPNTGLAIYGPGLLGNSKWEVVGGTSLSSPIIASVYAQAGNTSSVDDASGIWADPSDLNDVTSGNNGSCAGAECNAGTGWDGPTGLGTPNGTGAF
jgi:subtilase family serine protease